MRRCLYMGAAVAAAPGLLAFHVSPFLADHAAVARRSSRWRAVAPSAAAPAAGSDGGGGGAFVVSPKKIFNSSRRSRASFFASGSSSRRCALAAAAASSGAGDASAGNVGDSAANFPSPPPLKSIPQTCLVLRDEATGCDVYLVGCLHGSHASGRDVLDVLHKVRPGAVVLELCESRHEALRKNLKKAAKGGAPLEGKERWASVLRSWGKGVQSTAEKAGLLQGLLAGLLSAPYVVQRLGDFDPGLEFKTAMLYADASTRLQPAAGAAAGAVLPRREEEQGGEAAVAAPEKAAGEAAGRREGERGRKGLPGEKECAIVLGDRDVQETLRRLGGSLTALTGPRGGGVGEQHGGGGGVGGGAGMLGTGAGDVGERDLKASGESTSTWDWNWGVLASDARVLRIAVLGPIGLEWPDSLNVLDTVWRERQTLGTLLLPLLLGSTLVSEAFQRSIGGAASAVTSGSGGSCGVVGGSMAFGGPGGGNVGGAGCVSETASDLGRALAAAGDVFETLFVVGSVWYMLRFFRLVIKERDGVLAENVVKACRNHRGQPVVAVLGLLHCNGVAEVLRNSAGFRGVASAVGGED